jgi:hypothetical protein
MTGIFFFQTNSKKHSLKQNYKKLTPWSTVLEKLTVPQLVKKFPAFYGTQRFITVFTTTCHWSLT